MQVVRQLLTQLVNSFDRNTYWTKYTSIYKTAVKKDNEI